MRFSPLFALLLAGAVAASPRIAAQDAVRHRGERVTLVGPVASIESRPDGTVLMIGTDVRVPVRVPESARARVGELRGRDVDLTGSLTPSGQPLELVLDSPAQLQHAAESPAEEVAQL